MRGSDKKKYIITAFIIIFFVGLFIGHFLDKIDFTGMAVFLDKAPSSEEEIIDNCNGIELEDTAKCLTSNIRSIYSYNKTDDEVSLGFNDLVKRGGDCHDWTYFYMVLAKNLGFEVSSAKIDMLDNGNSHTYAIIGDKTGYCNLDQLEYVCYEYDK